MERIFLSLVGLVYVLLAIWCSVAPGKTSQTVGFEIQPGSGQSEFLVVYGGLELALGLIFLLPLARSDHTLFSLQACLVVHACLVLFRTIGFFVFAGIETKTFVLAAFEWGIFLSALVLWWRFQR